MKIQFFTESPDRVDLRPNKPTRQWMDETVDKYAYRCLPLNIANAHGWSFHLKKGFSVTWDGEPYQKSLQFESDEDLDGICTSTFGHGILTFHVSGVFRTEPGWNILATAPFNTPKNDIYPLAGVIETDWSPYSFTMNWRMARPNVKVTFEKGEPFCSIFPVQRGILQEVEPEILPIQLAPALHNRHKKWGQARSKFIDDLGNPYSDAVQQKWQKSYYRGLMPDGEKGAEDHITKLRLKPFAVKGWKQKEE